MTEQEAIKNINTYIYSELESIPKQLLESLKLACFTLREVQQYRAIGTPEELRTMKEHGGFSGIELAEIAVALTGFKEYQQIGTLEECRVAVEKQKSKKPDFEGDGYADGHLVYDTWICPCCGKHYEVDYDDYDFCPNCGQRLEW